MRVAHLEPGMREHLVDGEAARGLELEQPAHEVARLLAHVLPHAVLHLDARAHAPEPVVLIS